MMQDNPLSKEGNNILLKYSKEFVMQHVSFQWNCPIQAFEISLTFPYQN